MGILTHQTCRCISQGPWSSCLRGCGTVTAGEVRLSEPSPEAPFYGFVGVDLGSPRLSLGLDAVHTAQPWAGCRQRRGQAVQSFRWLFTKGAGGCTCHLLRCQGARLRLKLQSHRADWELPVSPSNSYTYCYLPFLFPPSQGLLLSWPGVSSVSPGSL